MTNHPFRFGASLFNVGSRAAWRDRVREVEDFGYDVLQVADHLGLAAPFPALVAAADVTSIRLGTYVLNAGILSPAYLARDVADVYRLTDGRLELGLGAGYVPAEFEAVGLPFGTGGERVRKLEAILTATRGLLAAEADKPCRRSCWRAPATDAASRRPRGRHLQLLHHGRGDTGRGPGGRVRPPRPGAARGRRRPLDDVELNLFVAAVGESVDKLDLTIIRQASGLDDAQLSPAARGAGRLATRDRRPAAAVPRGVRHQLHQRPGAAHGRVR